MSPRSWLLAFLFPCSALAFDILPEYQGLNESEMTKFERPEDIDSEYQTIINAFALPLEWEREWNSAPRAFDLSIGSMGNKHFLIYSRLKLEADLLETLRFQFHVFRQRDRETDQDRQVLELSQRIAGGLRFSLYGEPSLFKRENDVGGALTWQSARWSHRLYVTSHDLTRAEHNDLPDHFDSGRDPRSYGWSSSLTGDETFARFGFRFDQPVSWIRPQEERVYRYDKKLVYADWLWQVADDRRWMLRAQWDSTFEAQDPEDAASAVVAESWRRDRLQTRVAYRIGASDAAVGIEPAFMHVQRRWVARDGEALEQHNEMPGVTLHIRGARREGGFDRVRVEYEAGWFRRFGDLNLGGDQKRAPVEQRLQTGYEFAFRNRAKLLLAFNFDMDEWTPVPTFEGGNGMFRAEF